MYVRIDELIPDKITIIDLFTYSTIFQLAKFINGSDKDDVKKSNNLSNELEDLVPDLKQGKHSLEEIMERYNNLPWLP